MGFLGIDCACDTRPHLDAMKAAGVTHVVRYVGTHGGKCVGRAEAEAIRAAGLQLVAVYETTADMMRPGYAAGIAAAKAARSGVALAGGGPGTFVYFANDTDSIPPSVVNAFLDGASTELGASNVGLYGGLAWCESALSGGHCARSWQTVAWSHGKRAAGASMYQTTRPRLPGCDWDHDVNEVLDPAGNVGAWDAP